VRKSWKEEEKMKTRAAALSKFSRGGETRKKSGVRRRGDPTNKKGNRFMQIKVNM